MIGNAEYPRALPASLTANAAHRHRKSRRQPPSISDPAAEGIAAGPAGSAVATAGPFQQATRGDKHPRRKPSRSRHSTAAERVQRPTDGRYVA